MSLRLDEYLEEQEAPRAGVSVSVDLDHLIERIYMGRDTPPWQTELMKGLVKRFELDSERVIRSEFNDDLNSVARSSKRRNVDDDIPF